MATVYKTPGVWVEEISTLPPSVVQAATAIPAFIGYTDKLPINSTAPVIARITSLLEYKTLFCNYPYDPPKEKFDVTVTNDTIQVNNGNTFPPPFLMYYGLSLYFQNGGGPCYVVSVGRCPPDANGHDVKPDKAKLREGLDALEKYDEPTLIVLLDAVNLNDKAEYFNLITAALQQCKKLGDRFTIIDTPPDNPDSNSPETVSKFIRDKLSLTDEYLRYGAAYFPYLNTLMTPGYDEDQVNVSGVAPPAGALCWGERSENFIAAEFGDTKGSLKLQVSTSDDPQNPFVWSNATLTITIPPQGKSLQDLGAAFKAWNANNPNAFPKGKLDITGTSDADAIDALFLDFEMQDGRQLSWGNAGVTVIHEGQDKVVGRLANDGKKYSISWSEGGVDKTSKENSFILTDISTTDWPKSLVAAIKAALGLTGSSDSTFKVLDYKSLVGMTDLSGLATLAATLFTARPLTFEPCQYWIDNTDKDKDKDNGLAVTYVGQGKAKVRFALQREGNGKDATFKLTNENCMTILIPADQADTLTATQVVNEWQFSEQAQSSNFSLHLRGDGQKKLGDIKDGDGNTLLTKKASQENQGQDSSVTRTLGALKTSNALLYNRIKAAIQTQLRVTLPPSPAIAGIYAQVDRDRGVWKAPANVGIAGVIGPVTAITDADHENLNVDANAGKSINAIRAFTGKGTLVWGARTLDGNSNEWRYVPVRRLFITVEESVRKATAFAVFEPNDANTWLKVKAMIDSYLYGLWEQGALAGSKPEQAFYVHVGLGKTMTAQDILEGNMIVEIGLAAVRPAEFIVLKFSHKLQEA